MSSINSHKDLLIWKKGIDLVLKVFELTKSFPSEELFSITNQIKRAAISIPSNIAEGYGRNTEKSFSHYINISRGSLCELETHLIIAKELSFINNFELYEEILNLIIEESKMINAFSKSLNK